MESKATILELLIERAEAYGRSSYELYKLKVVDKTAEIMSMLILKGSAILLLSMFVFIINIGIAIWLGDLLGKLYYGFFCVAGFYGIIGSILYFSKNNWIKRRVSNSLISQILN